MPEHDDDLNGKAVSVDIKLFDENGNPTSLEQAVIDAQVNPDTRGTLSVSLNVAIPVAIGFVLLCLACGFWFWWR